jgi:hypothetical protein
MSPEDREQLTQEPTCYLCHIESIVAPATAIVLVDDQRRALCMRHASALDDDVISGDD